MGALLTDDVVFTLGFIPLRGKGFVLRNLPLLLGEVDMEVSEPTVEGNRAVARITMDGGALGSLEGEARLVVGGRLVSSVELVLAQVVVEEQPGRYRLRNPAFIPLAGAQAVYGELDGTVYRIEVPDEWNGRLVMWAHGFRDFMPELVADPPPIRLRMVQKGYAWAASSFSSNGLPYEAALETAALHDLFIEKFGQPEYTYAAGASMGGNAVLLSLELFPERYDGALAACSSFGADTIDFLGHYAALGAFAAGVERGEIDTASELAEMAVSRIMPTLEADPDARRVFESLVTAMTGGARPFRHEGFDARFRPNFALLSIARVMMPLDGLFDNTDTVYPGAPELGIDASRVNAEVSRVSAGPGAPEPSPGHTGLAGAAPVPLLTMHTTGDGFVPINLMAQFGARVEEAGNGGMLSARAIRSAGHCDFSLPEVEAALHDLAAWVEDGVKPPSDDLSGPLDDTRLRFTSPLRFGDPGGR